MGKQIMAYGVVVNPMPYGIKGDVIFAEVTPSGYIHWWRRLLPWVGNWWFEVQLMDGGTLAYEKGGSGGAYTFSGCVRKAMDAVQEAADAEFERLKK